MVLLLTLLLFLCHRCCCSATCQGRNLHYIFFGDVLPPRRGRLLAAGTIVAGAGRCGGCRRRRRRHSTQHWQGRAHNGVGGRGVSPPRRTAEKSSSRGGQISSARIRHHFCVNPSRKNSSRPPNSIVHPSLVNCNLHIGMCVVTWFPLRHRRTAGAESAEGASPSPLLAFKVLFRSTGACGPCSTASFISSPGSLPFPTRSGLPARRRYIN